MALVARRQGELVLRLSGDRFERETRARKGMPLDRTAMVARQPSTDARCACGAVGEADARTADHVLAPALDEMAGQPGEEQRDHAAGAIRGMDARAADFRDASALADDAADVELGRGIVATRSARAFGCQNAVGADDCVRVGITHEQMIAEAIELVGVDSARGQVGMQTLSVDPPAQPLRLEYLRVVAREPDAKARLLEAR